MFNFTTDAFLFLKISLVSLTLAPGFATHGCLRPCRPDSRFSNNYTCARINTAPPPATQKKVYAGENVLYSE